MELYSDTAYKISKLLTEQYSTSFGMSSRLFDKSIQPHIYAIYGMVRLADEIVDTYRGQNMMLVLNDFEKIVTQSVVSGYSTNPVVHAFALTAKKYDITESLTTPFFESMRVDVAKTTYDQADYEQYIYGSAEVIGLMCLKVFCEGDDGAYKQLKEGARALGAAYQKINFLRDVAADYKELGRLYFPGSVRYESFSEADKQSIIDDCKADLEKAGQSVMQLPKNAQDAVRLSWRYYTALLQKLENTPAEVLKRERVRISDGKKLRMLIPFLPRLVAQR